MTKSPKNSAFSVQRAWRFARQLCDSAIRRPERVVLVLGSLFGLLFLVLIPPMQGPDEPNHLFRAYQISEGNLVSDYIDGDVGGKVPVALQQFTQSAILSVFPGDLNHKYDKPAVGRLRDIHNQPKKVDVGFPNTAAYSPVAYAPRVVGIWIGRLLHVQPLALLYIARLSGLVFAVLIIAWAIKLMPFGKLPFAAIALLPMTLVELVVVSADTVMLPLCFLAAALTLRFAYQDKAPSTQQVIALLAVYALLCLTKPSLFPFALLSLALLKNQFMARNKKWLLVGGVVAVSLIATVGWNLLIKDMAAYGYAAEFKGASYQLQSAFVSHHPLQFVRVLYETFFTVRFDGAVTSFVGEYGWMDTPMPLLSVVFGLMIIAFAVFISSQSEHTADKLPRWLRLAAFVGGIGVAVITVTSQYLLSNRIGLQFVEGLQGRYFIPAALLLAIAFLAGQQTFSKKRYEVLSARVFQASAVLLVIALLVIIGRYYNAPALIPLPSSML